MSLLKNQIQKLVEAYDCTDFELSKILRVDSSLVSKWRSGKRPIPDYIDVELHLSISEAHRKRIKEYRL